MNFDLIVLTLAAGFTSLISATIGMAGGTVLLSILLFYFNPATSIALHALNQLASNGQRSWILRSHINLPFMYAFCGGALIGNMISVWLIQDTLTFSHAPLLIAVLIVYSLFKPKKMPQLKPQRFGFFVAGIFLGFIGMFVGATGLILGSLFVREDMSKEQIMATQGAIQSVSHGLKVLGFMWIGFDYVPWLAPLGGMLCAGIFGTQIGIRFFSHMSDSLFMFLYRLTLLASALYLLWKWFSGFAPTFM